VLSTPLSAIERPTDKTSTLIEYQDSTRVASEKTIQEPNREYRPPKIEGNAVAALILAFLSILFLAIYPPLGILSILVAIVCIIRSRIKISKEPNEKWRGRKFTTFAIILIGLLLGILGALIGSGTLQEYF